MYLIKKSNVLALYEEKDIKKIFISKCISVVVS